LVNIRNVKRGKNKKRKNVFASILLALT